MARFSNRVLPWIDRIFQFSVGEVVAPNEIGTEGPLQLVLDVGPRAADALFNLDRRVPGFIIVNQTNVHAGADTQENAAGVYTLLDTAFSPLKSGDHMWAWLMEISVDADADVLSSAKVILNYKALTNSMAAFARILVDYTSSVAYSAGRVGISATIPYFQIVKPILLPFGNDDIGTTLIFRTTSSGIGNIKMSAIVWYGPIGTFPPGAR